MAQKESKYAATPGYLRLIGAAAAVVLLAGCPDPPVGKITSSKVSETADNGDDSDGTAITDAMRGYASDGKTLAVSHGLDFRQFFVIADAVIGSNPKRTARANPLGETVSAFTIKNWSGSQNVALAVHAVVHPNITSMFSTVYYSLVLTNTTTGAKVIPVQTYSYRFSPNPNDPKQLDVRFNGAIIATIANNTRFEDVRPLQVKLGNGSYQFDLTWDVITNADGRGYLTAQVYVDLK
jgi:hypothetical protein